MPNEHVAGLEGHAHCGFNAGMPKELLQHAGTRRLQNSLLMHNGGAHAMLVSHLDKTPLSK